MKRQLCTLLATTLVAGTLLASGCNDKDKEAVVQKALALKFDPTMTPQSRKGLIDDIYTLMHQRISVPAGTYFDKAFGGTDTTSILHYLDQRVNYLIPQSLDYNSHLVADRYFGAGRAVMVAQNVGTYLYFTAVAAPQPVSFMLGSEKIPLDSSRVGIIEIGNVYSSPGALGPVERIASIIHEARHSDCTGGLTQADVQSLRERGEPINQECGHLHVMCPKGHEFEGLYACDGTAWGAYSIESLYASQLTSSCRNCDETTTQEAAAVSLDDLSRVLVAKDMLAGKLGDPDMSSGGLTGQQPGATSRIRAKILKLRAARERDAREGRL